MSLEPKKSVKRMELVTWGELRISRNETSTNTYEKLKLQKMDPKDLTTKKLWDGQWLETKYPHKFKKNEKR
jgi:hypothetical protein